MKREKVSCTKLCQSNVVLNKSKICLEKAQESTLLKVPIYGLFAVYFRFISGPITKKSAVHKLKKHSKAVENRKKKLMSAPFLLG